MIRLDDLKCGDDKDGAMTDLDGRYKLLRNTHSFRLNGGLCAIDYTLNMLIRLTGVMSLSVKYCVSHGGPDTYAL